MHTDITYCIRQIGLLQKKWGGATATNRLYEKAHYSVRREVSSNILFEFGIFMKLREVNRNFFNRNPKPVG